MQIMAELADQRNIKPLKLVTAITIKIGAWYLQILANLISGNPTLF